jgi:hypothetical protein
VLLLYDRPTLPWEFMYADNVIENIAAFGRHSRFRVWPYNVEYGFRRGLEKVEFDAVVIHYSVFIPRENYMLGPEMIDWLSRSEAYKVAFFQDEHHHCRMRFSFLETAGVDCVYTMLRQPYADEVYGRVPGVTSTVPHFPSYVSSELVKAAGVHAKPDAERRLDIGYRGRPMPAYMGRGALEKKEIADRFVEAARDSGLIMDIKTGEHDRIYAEDWHKFTADSRGTLGTESGVSCFDIEDEVLESYERLSADGHEPTIDELERDGPLARWDGKIPYRTVTPRNFEAAAFRTCQILYDGEYSGVMEPMRHYIPLRKDFSNVDEVIDLFKQPDLRAELTRNAYEDLIASGRYTYEEMISGFDAKLIEAGLRPASEPVGDRVARRALRRGLLPRWSRWRQTRLSWLWLHHRMIWVPAHLVLRPIRSAIIVGSKVLQTLGLREA